MTEENTAVPTAESQEPDQLNLHIKVVFDEEAKRRLQEVYKIGKKNFGIRISIVTLIIGGTLGLIGWNQRPEPFGYALVGIASFIGFLGLALALRFVRKTGKGSMGLEGAVRRKEIEEIREIMIDEKGFGEKTAISSSQLNWLPESEIEVKDTYLIIQQNKAVGAGFLSIYKKEVGEADFRLIVDKVQDKLSRIKN